MPNPPAAQPAPRIRPTIKAQLSMQGENLALRFPFASPTPAAVFRRADVLWLVFDTMPTSS